MAVDPRNLRPSATFSETAIAEIQRAASEGLYEIRGFGGKRNLPSFDDLVFLGASVSRYPLEGYRERCDTGMLLGMKITERIARMRTLPEGIDQRSAARHPDWTGPDDLEIKIQELREITNWEKPIYVKIGATRTQFDVPLAVKAGADVIVLDGMQGGTAATQDVFIEHVGIPTLPAVRMAVQALQELDMHRKVQLIVSGGIRSGADVAKALALGADAVSIGSAAMIALNCNAPIYEESYAELGTAPGFCHHCHTGRCPVGVTTQDPELEKRLDPEQGARRVRNYLATMVLETQTLARACGKSHVLNLEPEDMVALTVEAAAMAQVPLAGTNWIPGMQGSG
jgi:glutamate synthase domain-containing protein 2